VSRRITVQFIGDASSLNRATAQAESATGTLGGKLKKFGAVAAVGLAVAGTAAVKFAGDAISGASDLNETLSKSKVIFGKNAAAMEKWAGSAARSAGLSKQAALESAASFGDMFSQLGFAGKQAAGMSKDVVQLSADLGSFNNLPTAEVTDMMSAAFRGEYDSLQRVIPNINAARVEHEALAATGKKSAKELTAQEKAAATLAIVQKDGARAAGDFARTSGGLANQQKILRAQFDNVKAAVGKALLPVVTQFVTFLNNKGIPAISAMWSVVKDKLGPVFKWVGDLFKKVSGDMSGDASRNFGMVIDIVRGVVDIVKSLWSRFGENIIAITKSAWELNRNVIGGALRIIRGVVRVVSGLLKGDWGKAWAGVKDIVRGALQIVIALVKNAANILKAVWKAAWGVIRDLLKAAWGGIKGAVSAGADRVVDVMLGLKDRIVNALKALPGKAISIGRDIISGLIGGIKGAADDLYNMLRDLATNALNAAKRALDSRSPSRKFHKLGVDSISGWVNGTVERAPELEAALRDVGSKALMQARKGSEWAPNGAQPARLVKESLATAASVTRASSGATRRANGSDGGGGGGVVVVNEIIKLVVDGRTLAQTQRRYERLAGV